MTQGEIIARFERGDLSAAEAARLSLELRVQSRRRWDTAVYGILLATAAALVLVGVLSL